MSDSVTDAGVGTHTTPREYKANLVLFRCSSPSRSSSPGSSDGSTKTGDSDGSSKRKREEEELEDSGVKRRTSEEPLVRVQKPPFSDETAVEDDIDVQKKNIVKTMIEGILFRGEDGECKMQDITKDKESNKNGELEVIELDSTEPEKVKGYHPIFAVKDTAGKVVRAVELSKVKALRVDVKNVHNMKREMELHRLKELCDNGDLSEEEEEEEDPYEVERIIEYSFCKEDQVWQL